jgi:hypothetical protein
MVKCKEGKIAIDGRCKEVTNITISARRWFDKINGNTYHSVDVFVNGKHVGNKPFEYGYDEMYLQTAHKILQDAGVFKKTDKRLQSGMDKDYYDFMMDMREHRDKYVKVVSDVARKKDL